MKNILIVLVIALTPVLPIVPRQPVELTSFTFVALHVSPNYSIRPLVGARVQLDDWTAFIETGHFITYRLVGDETGIMVIKVPAGHDYVWVIDQPLGYPPPECEHGVNSGYVPKAYGENGGSTWFRGRCDVYGIWGEK